MTYSTLFLLESSILSVSDTEVLQFEWKSLSSNALERDDYTTKLIASANKDCCFQCSVLSDNRQHLAVATSKDNILLYNIESARQAFEYVGHTGWVSIRLYLELNSIFQIILITQITFTESLAVCIFLQARAKMNRRNGFCLVLMTKH